MTILYLSFSGRFSTRRGDNGAWQKFERGEIELWDFYVAFGRELSDTVLGNAWYSQHCARKGIGERMVLKPPVVEFSPFTDVFIDAYDPKWPFCRRFLSVLPAGHISECPKLPEKLEIDGRDVSGDERSRSFISGHAPVRNPGSDHVSAHVCKPSHRTMWYSDTRPAYAPARRLSC